MVGGVDRLTTMGGFGYTTLRRKQIRDKEGKMNSPPNKVTPPPGCQFLNLNTEGIWFGGFVHRMG